MDRPRMVRDPIGEERPVVVDKQVWEDVTIPNTTRRTRVLRYNPGDRISVEEALRLGVPLQGADGKPVTVPQAGKPVVETQDLPGPKKRKR